MIVVSNTSPIANLAAIGRLDLLQHLYGKVFLPEAVYRELTSISAEHQGAQEIQRFDWIESRSVTDRALVMTLETELDEGEAEAIALSIELKADLLLLDERRGRTVAFRLGLHFIGLLGVLVEAKQKGYIPAVKPALDALMVKAGFWVSQRLYARVLQVAGE